MVKGTVGFICKRRNWLSRVIAWATKSKWSHAFIVYQSEPEGLVLEAGVFQVHIVPLAKYQSKKYEKVFFVPKFPAEVVEAGIAAARTQIEKPYGWLQFLGFLPVLVLRRLFGLKISNPLRGGVVCSELVLRYLRGLEPGGRWDKMDKDSVTPEDLFLELSLHEGFDLRDQGYVG